MHLLMILIRWLLGVLAGGAGALRQRSPEASARTPFGPCCRPISHPDTPRAGWMKVRRLLRELVGLPEWSLCAEPVVACRGKVVLCSSLGRIRVARDPVSGSRSLMGRSHISHPVRG
jgi:hypothetical protein